MSKIATMDEAQAYLDDSTVQEVVDILRPLVEMAEEAESARQEALDAISEAMDHHEERRWDDRNDALDTASNAMETFKERWETLTAEISDLDGKMPSSSVLDLLDKHAEAIAGLL